jgi:uridine kinase
MTPAALLAALAVRIGDRAGSGVLRVGIDGIDGAGKTTLADRLGQVLEAAGHAVIRSSIDGFHNPRAVRYARGRDSAEGFYRDSFNLAAFKGELLDPLSPGGNGRFRRAVYDHRTDSAVDSPQEAAGRSGVLLVDGIFLHRPELRSYWDQSVFLDVPFEQSYRRMAKRDGSDPSPFALSNRRYLEGQGIYFAECKPQKLASILVDYADLENPRIVRG